MKIKIKRVVLCSITILCMILCSFGNCLPGVKAASIQIKYNGKTIEYKKSTVGFSLNGKNIALDTTPGIIINNISMGYYVDVVKNGLHASCKYDKEEQKLYIEKFEHKIELTLNSKIAIVDGKKKTMDVAMTKVKFIGAAVTRLMVPVRFVAENLGYSYTWDSKSKYGRISYNWLELYFDGKWNKYIGTQAKASFDGRSISLGNMPGVVIDGIAYLDGKKVFDSNIGASCEYDAKKKEIIITKESLKLEYPLDENSVIVNGSKETLNLRVRRVKNRLDSKYYLLVPARITANLLGYDYNWNKSKNTSEITTKNKNVEPEKQESEEEVIASSASIYFQLPKGVTLEDIKDTDCYYNNKFYLVVPGDVTSSITGDSIKVLNNVVSSVKVSLTSANNTKIVFSTKKLQGYKVHVDEGICWLEVGDPKKIYKNIVVLDCGHGGTDPGAQGGGYNEKDITFDILYTKAKKYFNSRSSKVKAYWTRYNDTFVSLNDRACYASKIGADIFVSLHMNSSTNTSAKGTEVYYSTANNKVLSNGLSSKTMAGLFDKALVEKLGTTDRKVKTANYRVIYGNTVPAVLIEYGFISNASDRELMIDEECTTSAAKTIYDVTANIFNTYPTGR